MEIDEIRVIVCEGQNLKGKKKDRCRASVIFGIGNDKFRTTIVDEPSGNVSWNEEQTFDTRNHLIKPVGKSVTNSSSPQPSQRQQQQHSNFAYKPLIFTVKDKERVIGRVTQALDKLSTTRKKFRCPLISPEPSHHSELGSGPIPYLVYECWITKYRASPAPTSKKRSESELSLRNSVGSELEKIKSKTSSLTRGVAPDFGVAGHRRQMSSSSSNASSTLPRSRHNAPGKAALISSVKSFFGAPSSNGGSFKEGHHSASLIEGSNPFEPSLQNSPTNDSLNNACQNGPPTTENDTNAAGDCGPVITGISPMQGPTTGGTKIVVRGQNLGKDADDIIGVYVCGVDCSTSLKYYTPSKIALTTPCDCPAGSGEILIVTRSGGASRCTVKFRFYRPDNENEQTQEEGNGHGTERMPQSSDTSLLAPTITREGAGSNYCYGGLYYLDLLKPQHESNGCSPTCNNTTLDAIMLPTSPHRGGSPEPSQPKTKLSDMNNSSELKSHSSAPRHFRRFKTTDLNTYENCSRENLLKEIYSLRRHVEDLTMENKLMRYYVDTLVLRVMEVCPEHLEKSQYKSTTK